jgi:hypothetical protein
MRRFIVMLFATVILCDAAPAAGQKADQGDVHPRFKISFTDRFRLETWDNAVTLSHQSKGETSYTRQRASLMGQWFPRREVELALKLTNEFRYYFVPDKPHHGLDEIFVDQLYLKWDRPAGFPGSVTLGRQNISLGEGFVVMDGGPLDGSRSMYFNAARVDWKPRSTATVTLFFAYQDETDKALPIIHDMHQPLTDQPEVGFGAYGTATVGRAGLQGYYIRKENRCGKTRHIESDINTIGARANAPLVEKLSGTVEAAVQFGSYGAADRLGYGGYAYLDYPVDWPRWLPRKFIAGTIYLSGDDLATAKYEGWDPLFGRWPKWSDSYIYTLKSESGVASWTNLFSLYAKTQFELAAGVTFDFAYHHLMAPHEAAYSLSGTGTTRGDLVIGRLDFRVNDRLTGHFQWEGLFPGDFYFDGADDAAWFRAELMYKI